MKNKNKPLLLMLISLLFFSKSYSQQSQPTTRSTPSEFGQQILLDKPVNAGNLKLFPGMKNDSNKYYYLPNKVRLAKHDDGKPKFLFLYYVTNVGSGNAEEVSNLGRGGGYVHLVIGLHVLPEELENARQELRKINPRGIIMGPVIYRSGTIALVTKSVITNNLGSDATNDLNKKKVLGIGPAPVLEGDNVAVSFILDSLDAKILWESLKSSTPDISFNLNMTIGGFMSPIGFKVEMNWDKVYKHKIFNAGLATPILKSEIGIATQDLRENAAILVTQVGENANLETLQKTITDKFVNLCFVPFGTDGTDNKKTDWDLLSKKVGVGDTSFLDKASNSLNKEVEDAVNRNEKNRVENNRRRARNDTIKARAEAEVEKTALAAKEAQDKAAAGQIALEEAQAQADQEAKVKENEEIEAEKNELAIKILIADTALARVKRETDATAKAALEEEARQAVVQVNAARQTIKDGDERRKKNGANKKKPDTGKNTKQAALEEVARQRIKEAVAAKQKLDDIKKETEKIDKVIEDESRPKIAVVASYQQKSIRHTGNYVVEAKSYFTSSLNEPFGDNIGKINCNDCIRKINTYDPLMVQRELMCFLDGDIIGDFNKYINYVTIMMRKKHVGGDITTDEVRVDRRNFNKEGNRFKLLYGWMTGDENRQNWLNYEFKTSWNFFGGTTIENAWQSSDQHLIPLSPPVRMQTVLFNADPEKVKLNNIRGITVRIFYKIGAQEQMKQVVMNVSNAIYSESLDFLMLKNESDFEYQIEWTKGNNSVKTGRIRTSQLIINVDEMQ